MLCQGKVLQCLESQQVVPIREVMPNTGDDRLSGYIELEISVKPLHILRLVPDTVTTACCCATTDRSAHACPD